MIEFARTRAATCLRLLFPVVLLLLPAGCGSSAPSPAVEVETEEYQREKLPAAAADDFEESTFSDTPESPATADASGGEFMPFEGLSPIEAPQFVEVQRVGRVEEDHLLFAPDGTRAYAAYENIGVYDVATWERTGTWELPDLADLEHLRLSRDGSILAAAHYDGGITVWDTATGECVQQFAHPPVEGSLGGMFRIPATFAVSPDGGLMTSGEGGTYESFVWEARTGKVLWKWTASWRDVKPADFSPADGTLAAMQADQLVFCDAMTGETKQAVAFGDMESLDLVRYSPDGQFLLGACDEEIRGEDRSMAVLFDTSTADVVWKIETPLIRIYSIAYSPDGSTVAITGELPRKEGSTEDRRAVQIRNSSDGRIRFTFDADGMPLSASTSYSADGKLLATGSRVWELPKE
ncbi:MAG: hypothetical protein KDA79_00050 [Planctomycetaceae bacterium]|nr:hypothetical protein [Planctomycetaceae bacterium]